MTHRPGHDYCAGVGRPVSGLQDCKLQSAWRAPASVAALTAGIQQSRRRKTNLAIRTPSPFASERADLSAGKWRTLQSCKPANLTPITLRANLTLPSTPSARLQTPTVESDSERSFPRAAERPRREDARHIIRFIEEQKGKAPWGYVVCRVHRPELLHERVMAIPWQDF